MQAGSNDRRILLVHDAARKGDALELFQLPVGRGTGGGADEPKQAWFAMVNGAEDAAVDLLQVLEVDQPDKSWFVGDSVQQDGKLAVVAPVDAALVLVGVLEALKNRPGVRHDAFQPAEDLLYCAESPDVARLAQLRGLEEHLAKVCAVQRLDDTHVYFRPDDEAALRYLCAKIDRIVAQFDAQPLLRRLSPRQTGSAAPLTERESLNRVRAALAALWDLLPSRLGQLVLAKYGLSSAAFQLPKAEPADLAVENAISLTDYASLARKGPGSPLPGAPAEPPTKRPATAASRALQKASTKGMKSLATFFAAKPA